jgi:hypothetical protein
MVILYQFNWLLYLPLLLEESLSRYLAYFRFVLCICPLSKNSALVSQIYVAVLPVEAERSCGLQLHDTHLQTESPLLCNEHRGMSQGLG